MFWREVVSWVGMSHGVCGFGSGWNWDDTCDGGELGRKACGIDT